MTLGEKATLTISAYVNYTTAFSIYTANIPLHAVIMVTVKSKLIPTLFALLSATSPQDMASYGSWTHGHHANAYGRVNCRGAGDFSLAKSRVLQTK
jgi:hypothetical protein